MDVTTGFFYFFSAVLLFAAFRVVTARNPVHAVLYLMLAFSQAAAVWMLLKAEFLAITLVLVYLGAVMVLFLFVVMMLDIRIEGDRWSFWQHFPLALLVGGVIAVEMAVILNGGFGSVTLSAAAAAGQIENTRELGKLLYTAYLYPLEIAAVLLLVAIIAAIALTLRQRKDSKFVDASEQVRVKARDRLAVVQVTVTREAPAPAPAVEEKQA
jgi:NADH-quinone oxidoreductase subunit J